jgi:hypothetical protein
MPNDIKTNQDGSQNKFRGDGGLSSFKAVIKNVDNTRSYDITSMMNNAVVYEDIFSKTMHGTITIMDGINLLNGYARNSTQKSAQTSSNGKPFPIVGEEYIEFTYQVTPDQNPPVFKRFVIYGIEEVKNNKELTMREYNIEFCSEEYLIDSTTLVQKSYQQQISDMVKDILINYLRVDQEQKDGKRKKAYEIQVTKGTQNIVIPRFSPLESLDFLARRAISDQVFESGSYLFFENKDGFNFCDIEYLIYRGKNKIKNEKKPQDAASIYRYFSQDAKLIDDKNKKTSSYKTILSINQKHRFDTIEKIRRGYFESDIVVFDVIGGSANTNTFRFLDNYTNYNSLGASPAEDGTGSVSEPAFPENSLDFMKSVTSANSTTSSPNPAQALLGIFGLTKNTPAPSGKHTKVFLIPKDTTQPDTYLEKIYPSRASYMTRFSQNMFTVDTHGDPNITVGDVIMLNLPEVEGIPKSDKDTKSLDYFISGYFMVTSIQHRFTSESYHTTMDIFKNGFSQPVISTNNTETPKAADTAYLANVNKINVIKG